MERVEVLTKLISGGDFFSLNKKGGGVEIISTPHFLLRNKKCGK